MKRYKVLTLNERRELYKEDADKKKNRLVRKVRIVNGKVVH